MLPCCPGHLSAPAGLETEMAVVTTVLPALRHAASSALASVQLAGSRWAHSTASVRES